MITCPCRQSTNIKLNAHIHNGKQNRYCKDYHRQFVLNLENKVITARDKSLIDKLLLEKILLTGIARTMEVSETGYLSDLYASCPDDLCADLPDRCRQKRE